MASVPPPVGVNVQEIMREIRARTRVAARLKGDAADAADRVIPAALRTGLWQLEASVRALHAAADQLGEVPPGPDTMRARLGARLIRLIQYPLFWLVMPLRRHQMLVAKALEQQSLALRELTGAVRQIAAEQEILRRKVSSSNGQS
jgi:hypothetical protein